MRDIKDFDMNQFVPEGSMTVTTVVGGGAQPSKRSVSSLQSELTERNRIAGQTMPTPQSEIIEGTESTLPNGEITPLPPSKQTVGPRQAASTSPNDQSVPNRQTTPAQTTEPPRSAPIPNPLSRVSSRQRRASLDEYREVFLHIPKIIDRQPVFVSRTTRNRLDRIVRLLGERGMSVSGLVENIALSHLETHEPDIEYWRKM